MNMGMGRNSKNVAALIVAAGKGTRAGGTIAKQWQPLLGRRVIDWTLEAFLTHPSIHQVAVVLPPQSEDLAASFNSEVKTTLGGSSRAQSVKNGLDLLQNSKTDIVLIHDAARPCVTTDQIDACIKAAENADGAALGLPMTDSVWQTSEDNICGTLDRSRLWRAQTPQAFDYNKICAAHAQSDGLANDDVEVALAAGLAIHPVVGSEDNLKITLQQDFDRAETILRGRRGH